MLSEYQSLRKEPSPERWQEEIRRIAQGQRESELQHIGGAQQYVERLLIDSDDPPKARTYFLRALEDVISDWRPSAHEEYGTAVLLELIAAHLPSKGFESVIGYLKQWGEFPGTREDLQTLALAVLQAYFPAAPPKDSKSPAFKDYVKFLEQQLDNSRYRAYSFRRLLELHVIEYDDVIVKELIEAPGVLSDFLRHALGSRKRILSGWIGPLLTQYLTVATEGSLHHRLNEIKGILEQFGAQVKRTKQNIAIYFSNGDITNLTLPSPVLIDRFKDVEEKITKKAKRKLEDIVAEAGSQWNELI